MEWTPVDIEHKQFRVRWRGLDPVEVESFLRQLGEEVYRINNENIRLKQELNHREKALQEYRDRDTTIKNVLFNAQKATEQIKANARKEAELIVAEAELQAEKLLQSAHQRLTQMHDDVVELKRQRTQLETKLRFTIENYRQLLDMEKEEEEEADLESKVKFLNPHFRA